MSHYTQNPAIQALDLGKPVSYQDKYTPSLLMPVPRAISRDAIGLTDSQALPFDGIDIWNAYEVSWLLPSGKPVVYILRCTVPITSPNLIESKSFKLYLNSFNNTVIDDITTAQHMLHTDLSQCAGADVGIRLIELTQHGEALYLPEQSQWQCIDELDITITDYEPRPSMLTLRQYDKGEHEPHNDLQNVSEKLYSNLLKSNCLVTNQPDWASVFIHYTGQPICRDSLLRYLISFRNHNEFHEQCVERIFNDINNQCRPAELSVYARYTRRGGLDINPFRSNFEAPYDDWRLIRQ